MKIETTVELKIKPDELGRVAAKMNVFEARDFWFGFVDNLAGRYPDENESKISDYAKALCGTLGGNRKKIFEALYHSMKYHEMTEK